MPSIRSHYDKLPIDTRRSIKSLVPKRVQRWYAHANTDVYLISYPKCGRTWLRILIGRAISLHFSIPDDEDILFLNLRRRINPDIPRIAVVHDDRPMLKTADELEESKSFYKDKKVLFLVRDPRDVIVSSYYEMKKRGLLFGENPYENRKAVFEGSLSDFICRDIGGFDSILKYFNIWEANRFLVKGFLLVRYEDIQSNPYKELRRVLDFLGLGEIEEETIKNAVEYASFENMRKMESDERFESSVLKPANREDINSYKTREGKVGGYVKHIAPEEIKILDQKIRDDLSDYFGYNS